MLPSVCSAPRIATLETWRSWISGSTAKWSTAGSEIFFHLYVMVVQEYFASNTEARNLMIVLRHRHQSDHECERLEIPKPRMAATQALVKNIIDSKTGETGNKRRKGAKNSETAAKIALMKLKMHADGDESLPQAERIYFQVFLPKGSKDKSKPMFFCHRWSIGKAIDFAASLASLKNDNNRLAAKKLRLCHTSSGEALPLDHTLETWLAKEDCPLYNGGNIILEYLNDDEQSLKNVDSYLS
ncbi:AN1-type zinc finger protein 1 isoform X3 [Octodon degus]|uniref:AN1-type zinc finger protein 1 isoform X3 n=1 Tax=Octodon degus TaxID=10160 RepID=A0A6P6DFU1_OCTDE|nr:AN1-type zinc finger protein 1 isoform X3 [Octodon degus]